MPRWRPFPIVGGSYADDTKPWSVQDTVNYLPVSAERSGTRSPSMLKSAPGFKAFCNLGTGLPIRGAHNAEGLLLVVSGNTLFSVSPKGVATNLGTIPGVGRVSMAHNQITGGNQIAIANGLGGYVYDTTKGTLTQITDEGFAGAIDFDYVDSYIVGVEPGKRFWFTSDLADATSYNTLDRYEAEGSPDKIMGLIVTHREVWVMGERTIEPFQNAGTAEGTFQRAAGMVMERGLASTFAMALLDNSVFWLGDDGCVYRANGYQPVRVSTFPIEQAIARCNMSQAFAFTFEDQGHKVFYLTFPDGQTWGYDVASGEWHRRKSDGLDRWRINTLTRWKGHWIAGDYTNGKLYELNWDVQDEDGAVLERRRVTGVLSDNQNRVTVNGVALVFDTGTATEPKLLLPQLSISGHLPSGRTGEAASYQYAAGGGVFPRVVSIASGALPTGLSMNTSGLVTGTRTTVGSYTWTVRVIDADGSFVDLLDASETTESLDTAIMADGPLGYWKADEASGTVMTDSSGNGYHGIYNTAAGVTLGNAPLRAGGRGSLGVSVATWGARVPANTAIEIAGSGRTAWAMEVVVKKTGGLSSVFSQVFGAQGSIGGDGQRIFYRWGTDRDYLLGRSYDSGTDVQSPNATTGQVVHAIFERNGASANLYENGTLVATGPTAVSAWFGDLMFLGTSEYSSSYAIAATASDFAIYDHALGPTRALAHAKAAGLA